MNTISSIAGKWISGLPAYEPGRPIEEVARTLGFKDAQDIIKLASNENSLGPSPLAVKAMRTAAADMHRYPDGGLFRLTAAMAGKLDMPPGCIVFGNGSNELIEFIGRVFLKPGSNIVVADHSFLVYRIVASMHRAETISVPMRRLTHDLDAMLTAVTPETRIVFIGNPNNPTGTMVTGKSLDRFISRIPGHVIVVIDEAYVELLAPERQPDTLKYVRDDRNVVVIRTFSKTYGLAGLRLGYGITPENCARLLQRVRQPFNVNAMAQAAALAALDDETHVARTRTMVSAGLKYFEGAFSRLGLAFVRSVTNFMLVKTGAGRDIFNLLMREGVIVRPMDIYGLPDYIRITVGTREENERCIKALAKVLKWRP